MKDFNKMLDEYAKLCVEVGINLQKGQPLVINSPVEGADFVRLVAKHAYELGAKEVHVNWNDEALARMKYENAPMGVFEKFPKWYADGLEEYAENGAGFLSIYSQDPELLKGIDPKKIAASNKSSSMALKGFRKYTMNDVNAWCVVSIPTQGWANRVFPEVSDEEAMEKLWEAIFMTTRMDLEIRLPEGHIWAGGGGKNSKDVFFVANMPTEEVFTMPLKTGVNGVVCSTKPLNYGGNLIDNFKVTFENGKVVDFAAEEGYEVLKDLLSLDEGAKHLGEVALVPYDSPISNSNIIFLNTLFDENASCHLAFGKAYPTNIKGGENMTDEELEKAGVNDSLTHVDFMVGSKDLSIIGETKDGEKVQIFEDGNWAF